MKTADAPAKSQSSNRVPDAEELKIYRAMAVVLLINGFFVPVVLVNFQHLFFFERPPACRQTGGIDQSGKATDPKGAATEAKAKDSVAILIALGKETIGIADPFRCPGAGCALEKSCDGSSGADTI